jgi:hypothetical protein
MFTGELVYEDRARYDFWLPALLGGIILIEVGVGIWSVFRVGLEGALYFVIGLLLISLFYFIMPRKFQIYSDRLVIVLGGPLAWKIPLSTIKQAQQYSSTGAMAYRGMRFVTSTKYVLEIVRSPGSSTVISPAHGEEFLEQLNQTLKRNSSFR